MDDQAGEVAAIEERPLPMGSGGSGTLSLRLLVWAFCVVLLMVVLRVVALDSDPYARLSWSSGLLTDEGYYIHNARNVVLFGAARTDEFNNMLIMPTLHFVQVAVFRQWGAGALPARMISVVCSLLGICVLFLAARRAFGIRVACYATALLGLDHINLLYNRLALMDTPGQMLLIFAFFAWVRGVPDDQGRPHISKAWLAACGTLLALAFITRGLSAFVLPVPFVAAWLVYRSRTGVPPAAKVGDGFRSSETHAGARSIAWTISLSAAAGLAIALAAYVALWYLPHRAELATVSRYYLWHQLMPGSMPKIVLNIGNAWFGDERGAAPFFVRHSPVVTFLVFALIVNRIRYGWRIAAVGTAENESTGRRSHAGAFVYCWLALAVLTFSMASYSPSRYYLLFTPAMAIAAAAALADARSMIAALLDCRPALFLCGAYSAYHGALLAWHHASAVSVLAVAAATLAGGAATLAIGLSVRSRAHMAAVVCRVSAPALLVLWAGVNAYYLQDWLLHLTYGQRNASLWMAANLPARSVLVGDVAPGLCLYNSFKAISVIPGLCNDDRPVERYHGQPTTIVILDEADKERWWVESYPALTMREKRTKLFLRIVRFPVGLYTVPPTVRLPADTAGINDRREPARR